MATAKSNHHSIVFDLILGITAIFLVALSIWSVVSTWSESARQSELSTTSKFVGIRTSPRVTETPGINSWVSLLLESVEVDSSQYSDYLNIVKPSKGGQVPEFLSMYSDKLAHAETSTNENVEKEYTSGLVETKSVSAFRDIGTFSKPGFVAIATLQKNEKTRPKVPEHFCELVASCKELLDDGASLKSEVAAFGKSRLARVYLVDEFGNFYSHPFGYDSNRNREDVIASEFRELQKNKLSPTFANNEFFFQFDYEKDLADQKTYSGIYLDQGGLGLVATIAVPRFFKQTKCVLAVDIEFDFDWKKQIQTSRTLASSALVDLGSQETNDKTWTPWNLFLKELGDANDELKESVASLARKEIQTQNAPARKSVYHETTSAGTDVVAIQVNRNRWLLFSVKQTRFAWPWLTIILSAVTLAFLFYRVESGRRSAVQSRKQAAEQLQEKQNLLNTMQVPLMVSDPNTDEIIFCNEAATKIGMKVGAIFGRDIVMDNEFAQSQYQKMQAASEESRRAYGVPIRVKEPEGTEERLAIIRSVAVTAPIETLNANQRHRLGILFLINQDYDIGYLLDQHEKRTKNQERRLLSGLLNHGLESLAIMLTELVEQTNSATEQANNSSLPQWLAHYVSQRINVLSWTLENWETCLSPLDQRVLGRRTVEETISRYESVFDEVKQNRQLRQQLHWNNGVLSQLNTNPVIEVELNWPDDVVFQIPKEGLFGLFIGEVLVNAIKHGEPGSTIQFNVSHDPVRAELKFKVSNQIKSEATTLQTKHGTYGGQSILNQISHLCSWDYSTKYSDDNWFVASWVINSIRSSAGKGD